jgi:hypothetical protein
VNDPGTTPSTDRRRRIRRSSTSYLAFIACLAVIVSAYPAFATFDYIRDRVILGDRGVQADVWVVDYNWVRKGPDTVVVRPDDPPYFEATLSRGPSDLVFNDRLDVLYDPRNPGRIVAVDEPLIDGVVLLFAGLDLFALVCLLAAVVAVGELLRRAVVRRKEETALPRDEPPASPRTRFLATLATSQVVLLLVVLPVLGTAIFGLLAASSINDAEALRTTGVTTRAVVVKSTWDGAGELDVRFPVQDGIKHSAHVPVQDGVYYEGDSVDIVYEPARPANARLARPGSGPDPSLIYLAVFIAFGATAAVSVPTAVGMLVGRANRKSGGPA